MLRRRTVSNVAAGPGLGAEVVDVAGSLTQGRAFRVGRNSGNSLPLDHPSLPLLISRHHASFACDPAGPGVLLTDCGATNGTWVNEVRLPAHGSTVLTDGDVVSFGGPGSIMKDGAPFDNPFVYDYEAAVPNVTRHDAPVHGRRAPSGVDFSVEHAVEERDEEAEVEEEREEGRAVQGMGGGPDAGSSRQLAARSAAPGASSRPQQWASPGPSRLGVLRTPPGDLDSPLDSPMQSVEVGFRRSSRISNAAALFHDQSQPSPVGSEGGMSMDSPRVRLRASTEDVNPSPSKRGRLRKNTGPLNEVQGNVVGVRGKGADRGTMAALENSLECVVCREWMIGPHSLVPCGHMFCGNCIYEWMEHHPHNPSCPSCRAKVSAPPVRCLPVENIISDIVQVSMSPGDRQEHMKRRAKWDKVAKKATESWASQFSGPMFYPLRSGGEQSGGGDGAPYQGSNFNLNLMLDNLRQVRETLRSVTQAEGGGGSGPPQVLVAAPPVHTVEYARSSRSRCATCQEMIAANHLRVGVQRNQVTHGSVPITAHRWHHFECFPAESWAAVSPSTLRGLRTVSPADQTRMRARMEMSTQS